MKGEIIVILAFICFATFNADSAYASEIAGDIYDLSLNRIGNVAVEINTAPKQFIVSKNGTYSFDVPIGTYEIRANQYNGGILVSSASENITVKEEGVYVMDLVLFPVINEDEIIGGEINRPNAPEQNYLIIVLIGFGAAVFLFMGFFYFRVLDTLKKIGATGMKEPKAHPEPKDAPDSGGNQKENTGNTAAIEQKNKEAASLKDAPDDDLLKNIIRIIQDEGGRSTQKDIRKRIPLSESKISLAITQLEVEGRVKKIKKGRGNVIILG